MSSAKLFGIILVAVGVIALVYQGIRYTTKEKVVDIGPVEVTQEKTKTIPLPPVVGGLALVGGIALLATGRKN